MSEKNVITIYLWIILKWAIGKSSVRQNINALGPKNYSTGTIKKEQDQHCSGAQKINFWDPFIFSSAQKVFLVPKKYLAGLKK